MSEDTDLTGITVLVAEDEALIALDIEMTIEDSGGEVVGPFGTLEEVLDAVGSGGFDVALLDIMLGRDEVFPAADMLRDKNIPFAFHSGHGAPHLSGGRYENTPMLRKPCLPEEMTATLVRLCKQR